MRTRTRDLLPAFKSHYARRVLLPIFHKKVVTQSGYLFPVADVDAQIAARLETLRPPRKLAPDLSQPEPLSIVDAPIKFADDFWRNKVNPIENPPPPPKPKAPKPRGRKPVGDLPPKADRFRVIDGDRDGDKKK